VKTAQKLRFTRTPTKVSSQVSTKALKTNTATTPFAIMTEKATKVTMMGPIANS